MFNKYLIASAIGLYPSRLPFTMYVIGHFPKLEVQENKEHKDGYENSLHFA